MSWRQHVPFAMLLVDLVRPRTLVELGVHYGDSYCSFCQAVAELRLATACYGVDTWKGDPHASYYGPEVLADLAAHHNSLYGGFSHLMQSTFDEALKHFGDGTIDILHIDGYHTYEAVKHDFEAWLPKMSPRGVVLLHDINEKQRDFGAWKVWDEIKVRYPHFEFMHCHGLGILAAGQEPPEELSWLFGATDKRVAAIRDFFFCLGERLTGTKPSPINRESAPPPFSGAAGDWVGLRIELEDRRVAMAEFDAIRGSIAWQLARKLHSLANAALPLGSRRRGLAKRILARVRARSVRSGQHSAQELPNRRTELARKYLRGVGLAIGSLDPNLRVSPNVSVDCADVPNYEGPSELETPKPRSQATDEDMKRRRETFAEINDEAYDFVVCDHLPGNLPHPIEALQTWLRVVRPGGIVYLAVPDGSIFSKSMSDLQSDGLGIRVVDSAMRLEDGSKDQIYIVEKANYVSKITDMLRKNPQATSSNAEYTIDVVVPIYNACEELERCLYSLFKHQDVYRIILIDDCSTDKRVKELLDALQEHRCERFEIVENVENLGYLKTVNKGMRMVRNDVILLNSDTIVTSGWARKLRACAYSHDRIATVTPFTNNGAECSIPDVGQNNEIPEGFTINSFAELVENCSVNRYPELVTAVGFCMYVRRVIIEEIGYFDEEKFGRGYGEENDFSIRAARKGYKNVLCDNVFVFHKGAASFSSSRNALIQKSAMILEKLYPDFWPALHLFWRSNPLKELQNNVKREMRLRSAQRDAPGLAPVPQHLARALAPARDPG
jgi:GT2 family glycosyltransferase/predicted O-methyltransferase YrrM